MMLFALVLSVLGATTAFGQKIYKAELDNSMFKAWVSNEPGAQEDPNPATEPKADNPFTCENNLYKEVSAYGCIWGSSSVYYLWYADLTGTTSITVTGTPGMSIRMMFNREPYVEGGAGDLDGGAYVERIQNIGDDGSVTFDVSDLTYVHLNAIKVPGGGTAGVVRSIVLEGTVKPVTGILPLVWNGDVEGDDFSSFALSYDGPNNGGTAIDPLTVVNEGVNGSKCFKVVTYPDPTEVWHTQFYIVADEVMPKGSKFALKMWIKADKETKITTSSQAEPRAWKGGFINEFSVGTEWKEYNFSGEISADGVQSFAFDLNNGDERNADDNGWVPGNGGGVFYFDNIEFGYDLGSANPASEISASYGADVIEVNLNGKTNMKDLVKAADGKKVIFPNDCVNVTWNGKPANPISVEGRDNGNLYIFLLDVDGNEDYDFSNDVTAEVKVSFTNPAAEALHLQFAEGKWEGEAVPDFSGLVCKYDETLGAGEFVSYIWGAAELEAADPENGSFNLPADMSEFTMTFNQKIEVASVVATLGKEKLTASADGEFSKVIKLKRTASTTLAGEAKLYIDKATTDRGYDLDESIVLIYSFGPVVATEGDEPEVLYVSNFTNDGDDAQAAGWIVTADNQAGMQPANSGSGNRLQHGQTGYAADVLYLAQRSAAAGIALYGTEEDHKLTLTAGKTYHLTLKSAQWDAYPASGSNRTLRAQILTEDAVSTEDGTIIDEAGILGEEFKVVDGRVKEDKEFTAFDIAFTPEADGNFVIRLVSGNLDGNPAGFGDGNAIADVKVEYLPSTMGLLEMKTLAEALENAKTTMDNNSDERFKGTAQTTLSNLIKEYDGKTMTAPSAYAKATADLNAAVKALNDHVTLCNEYDALPVKAFNLYDANKNTKFNVTEYFASLKAAVVKYCTLTNEERVDEETGEANTVEVMESFKLFYDDAELTAAKAELTDVITLAGGWLTDEVSRNVYGHVTTGYAALHERLRRGVALLQSLGVSEDAPEIVAANAELGDNDEIAEAIIQRASLEIFKDLASGESSLFTTSIDENGEEVGPSYDLSVFAKNPNIYGPAFSTEAPGWTNITGNGYAWSSWDGATNHSDKTPYPEDCNIHAGWHPSNGAMTEQTVVNLPAGIYTVKIDGSDNNSPISDGTFGYVKTSATPLAEEGEELDMDIHFAGYVVCSGTIEGIEVLDGELTVGFSFGTGSQAFLNDVEIRMTSPVDGHNYATDYEKIMTGVDTAKTAKVRAIEMYDLNGRRINSARKGLVIVKKLMSDGTIKTQKVVK